MYSTPKDSHATMPQARQDSMLPVCKLLVIILQESLFAFRPLPWNGS